MTDADYQSWFNDVQNSIMLARRIQLAVGCSILLLIVVSIIRKKLYVYNTTKLFMWFCICYFIGMFVVLLHTAQYMSAGYYFAYDTIDNKLDPSQPKQSYINNKNYLLNILNEMKKDGSTVWCGLQGFINLYIYDFGYFFALLVSYNVFCVMKGNYRNFMKGVLTNWKVILFLIIMLIIYVIPLALMFMTNDFKSDQYAYSYGPMGFNFEVTINNKTRSASLLLFGGFVSKPADDILYKSLTWLNIYICPVFMLLVHSIIIYLNRSKINAFYQQQYLNSKQRFLIKSGKLGFIVFAIQLVHFSKSILVPLIPSYWVNLIISFLFDLYPVPLFYFYMKYTRQKSQDSENNSAISQDLQD